VHPADLSAEELTWHGISSDIDGTPYILEASWVGTPIHVVPLTRSDHDSQLHRYWT